MEALVNAKKLIFINVSTDVSIIRDIFGKDNGITEDDLKNIYSKYQETSQVECKCVTDLYNKSQNNKEYAYHNVIKTVIGFLNKPENDSSGLLMLGVKASKGVIENIDPIKNNDFKQDSLRNRLKEDIRPIPTSNRSYTLDVLEAPVTGGYVTLIEVHKTDPNSVFYSKNENTAYIRHSDTTKKWDLGDMFKVAVSKSYPIVYVDLLIESVIPLSNDISTYNIQALIKNVGTSPGQDAVVLLKFHNPTKGQLSLQGGDFILSDAASQYSKKLEKDILSINSKPIYPQLDLKIGSFAVSIVNDGTLQIDTIVYEHRGITTRVFKLADDKILGFDYRYIPYFQ